MEPGLGIYWGDYIFILERMTYLLIVTEFKLQDIKITNTIFYDAYIDYLPAIWSHCTSGIKYNTWNDASTICQLIFAVLDSKLKMICQVDEGDLKASEYVLRCLKLYLHIGNHFHRRKNYRNCPVKEFLDSHLNDIYRSLLSTKNRYILSIAKNLKEYIISRCQNGILKFFEIYRDKLFILSIDKKRWMPWMKAYSRFILEGENLVEVFEKDCISDANNDQEDLEDMPVAEAESFVVREAVPAELLLSSDVIVKMRDWADKSKIQLFKLKKISVLPPWDKTRLEVETHHLFKRSRLDLDSNLVNVYLENSLDILSRIHSDLNDITILLKSLSLDKIKERIGNSLSEEIDHLHEYKDILLDQLSNLKLTKSLLESNIKYKVKEIKNKIDEFCQVNGSIGRLESLLERTNSKKRTTKRSRY